MRRVLESVYENSSRNIDALEDRRISPSTRLEMIIDNENARIGHDPDSEWPHEPFRTQLVAKPAPRP